MTSWYLSFVSTKNTYIERTENHETHDMYEALDMVFEWARRYM